MEKNFSESIENRDFEKIIKDRLPKVLALREKFGYYVLNFYPKALDMYDELMKDDIPEPFKTMAKVSDKRKFLMNFSNELETLKDENWGL